MRTGPKVFVSAGEVSGDQILGGILARLRGRYPEMEVRGLGGSASEACGLKPLFPMRRTAISGAWDVIRNLAFALAMYVRARRALRRFRPDLAILVDYPGLNLRLARLARNLGGAVLFVAPPQAWAYRKPGRKLARARAALRGCAVHVLFPFERDLYAKAAASLTAGHFLDSGFVPSDRHGDRMCLCPGSRLQVLRRNLSPWLDLLAGSEESKEIDVLVPAHLEKEAVRIATAWASRRGGLRLRVGTDKEEVLAGCSAAIAFPGTITLELALRRIPTLVLALLDPLTLALGRHMLGSMRLALPNLLLGEDLFPEWVGTAPGPEVAAFRVLLQRAGDARIPDPEREARRALLEGRIGPGNGAEEAELACLNLLAASGHRHDPMSHSQPQQAAGSRASQ